MRLADLVGVVGIAAFYPLQNGKLFMTRDPAGLSLPAFVSLFIGVVGFTVLGFLMRKPSLLVANGVGAVFTAATIAGILLWG